MIDDSFILDCLVRNSGEANAPGWFHARVWERVRPKYIHRMASGWVWALMVSGAGVALVVRPLLGCCIALMLLAMFGIEWVAPLLMCHEAEHQAEFKAACQEERQKLTGHESLEYAATVGAT